MEQTLFTQQR